VTAAAAARRGRDQGGVVAVEFALMAPLLSVLVFGLIQFGAIYNDFASLREGTRDAARQAAVANFGPASTTGSPCYLDVAQGSAPSADIESLMCLAKSEIGLSGSDTRVDVLFAKPDFSGADSAWTVGDGLIVCTQFAEQTQTQLLASLIGSPYLKTKTSVRIEQPAAGAETAGYETPPSGSDWSWCTVSSSTP
jgi:Flp pilus assembly pilin Flp